MADDDDDPVALLIAEPQTFSHKSCADPLSLAARNDRHWG
jgi:hypothetical protein